MVVTDLIKIILEMISLLDTQEFPGKRKSEMASQRTFFINNKRNKIRKRKSMIRIKEKTRMSVGPLIQRHPLSNSKGIKSSRYHHILK